MGCGNSKLDVAKGQDSVIPEMAQSTGARFNSYLATLPPLFSQALMGKTQYLCTAHVPSDFRSMVFACVDSNANYFEKFVLEEELIKTRNRLNVDGTLSTWQFLNALKHSFFNHKVVLEMDPDSDESLCRLIIEFNFVTIGTTTLKLELSRVQDPYYRISSVFLSPLYQFYSVRLGSEKVAKLETEIQEYEKRIKALENGEEYEEAEMEPYESMTPAEPNLFEHISEHVSLAGSEMASNHEIQEESSLVGVPADKMLKFLTEIKNKLIANHAITENEQKSFNQVVNILMSEEQWDVQFSQSIDNVVDMEVMGYLKSKFAVASMEERTMKETDVIAFIPPSEWKTNDAELSKDKQIIFETFERVDDWDFDVFAIEEYTHGHSLFVVSYTLMVKYDFLNKFNISEQILINFLKEVESGYHPNPYHNSLHAADVLQVVHYSIAKGGASEFLRDEETFSVLLSAIIHDYDHPGLNNAFLVNAKSYLATLYNDRSILENHHSAQSFELMKSPQFDIFSGMTVEKRKEIRDIVIDVVLATDMGRHAKLVAKFKAKLENGIDLKKKEDIRLILQIIIKVADVNNTSRPTHLYLKWADRIVDEFYKQGDKERQLELPVTPLMDRTKASMSKGQIAFVNYLVIPMFTSFAKLLPKMSFILNYLEDTKKYWEEHEGVEPEFLVRRDTDIRHELNMQ